MIVVFFCFKVYFNTLTSIKCSKQDISKIKNSILREKNKHILTKERLILSDNLNKNLMTNLFGITKELLLLHELRFDKKS